MELGTLKESRVLLLGFTVPEDVTERICRTDRFMSLQTHKLAWSVVRGLEVNGAAVDLLSTEPVGTYPSNKQIFFRFRKWDRENGSWNVMMPFINLFVLKHITRFFASLFLVGWWTLRTHREQNRFILLHGVHSPFMYAALAVRQLSRIKVVTIASDPPGVVLSGEGFFVRLLRKLDVGIITKALRSMDGLIALTMQLTQKYAPQVPSIIVEGILYADDNTSHNCHATTQDDSNSSSCFIILYSGALYQGYGVELLLAAFSLINDSSFRLWILGKGDLAEQIQIASKTDDRIVFKGFCSQSEVKQWLSKATVLINPRLSNQSFTLYSFPSKTIEYMASGRPVISTRLPGIPEEYFSHVFPLEKETPEDLCALFMRLKAIPRIDLEVIGTNGRKFILENKNETYQGQRILKFLQQLLKCS